MNYGVNIEISNGEFEGEIESRRDSHIRPGGSPYLGWSATGIWVVFIAVILFAIVFVIAKIQ
jgi:hypothetical protein